MERIWQARYQGGVPFEVDLAGRSSIVGFLEQALAERPDQVAFACAGSSLGYRGLDALSRAFAGYLRGVEGLDSGDRVAIMLPNLLHYPVVVFGALRAGLTLVNLNPNYTAREVRFHLQDSGARVLVTCGSSLDAVRDAVDGMRIGIIVAEADEMPAFQVLAAGGDVPASSVAAAPPAGRRFVEALAAGRERPCPASCVTPDMAAFLQYTGGTTGRQKAAVLTHRNLTANLLMIRDWFAAGFARGDECLATILPIYHVIGLSIGCFFPVAIGCKNVLIPNPRNLGHFVDELREHRVSFFVGVNTLFNALLEYEPFRNLNPGYLRHTYGAGAQVEPDVAKRWHALTGCRLLSAYGLTEASPAVCMMPLDAAGPAGSVGLPLPSTDLRLLDGAGDDVPPGTPGEIAVKGPQVMTRYWNRPDETRDAFTADGFLLTGDIGTIDPDGFVRIVDRKKDVVLVSGFNVYPNEIEAVVGAHPGVLECACIGVPDDRTGEALRVFVVARDRTLTADALQQFSRERLTAYKVPRQFEFVDALPKSSVGKVLRRALRT
ncbi:AMP-binding protein [Burkholderia stabilis]|uniref:AMP-binding protein n=1 Tax=Burkholderia stabilis TaxID=95485 RepID=UPI001F4A8B36|nr:AMP-binding protein [Burkholderia stabilis]